jgi:hypothetical protein
MRTKNDKKRRDKKITRPADQAIEKSEGRKIGGRKIKRRLTTKNTKHTKETYAKETTEPGIEHRRNTDEDENFEQEQKDEFSIRPSFFCPLFRPSVFVGFVSFVVELRFIFCT